MRMGAAVLALVFALVGCGDGESPHQVSAEASAAVDAGCAAFTEWSVARDSPEATKRLQAAADKMNEFDYDSDELDRLTTTLLDLASNSYPAPPGEPAGDEEARGWAQRRERESDYAADACGVVPHEQ